MEEAVMGQWSNRSATK